MNCHYKLVHLLLFTFMSTYVMFAQIPYSETNFRAPLDIPLVLAGTFGELRSNHFHSGIDIKTKGKEGFPIIAIEDGYVSRVKTNPGGYGKALYLTHYNGYVSVYAHLQRFDPDVSAYLLDEQYKKQEFSVDLFPEAGNFAYQKGDTIAWTGNTGSSTAPHLHFEIRDAKTQEIINPLLFGFKAKDTTPPTIKNLHIYPLDDQSGINGLSDTLRIPVLQITSKKYHIDPINISVKGSIGFGIDVFDQLDNAPNKNGVFSIELFVDSMLIYKHDMERFDFSETRYINSHMDYHAKKKYALRPQKSFKDPNNKLSIYEYLRDEGRMDFDSQGAHQAEYVIKDIEGNTSKLAFHFSSDSTLNSSSKPKGDNMFLYQKDNKFKDENITLFIARNSLYDDLDFSYSIRTSDPKFVSDIHCIHHEETPVHSPFSIAIVVDSLDEMYREKALICSVSKKGEVSCLPTQWVDDTLQARSRTFGDYGVVIDTIPPGLKPESFSEDLSLADFMSFTVEDSLSGLSAYNAFVDGEWILLEYDPKNKKLIHYFDGKVKPGQHELEIVVEDSVKNEKRLKLEFVR